MNSKYKYTVISLLFVLLTACHPPLYTPEEEAALRQNASRPITCSGKMDCDVKWSRALEWVEKYSRYRIRLASNHLIETYGPSDRSYAGAFVITKRAEGNDYYTITFRVRCVDGYCTQPVYAYKSSFVSAVMDGK